MGLLLVTSYLATALAALFPVLMAPILDLALGVPAAAPAPTGQIALHELTLKNLGAAFFQWLGFESVEHRFRAIVLLCLVYVAVGFLKGWVDFGNYLLALWIRVRAGATIQTDLFRHLLGLSMGFFSRQRAGELVSRLDADTRAATSGLETNVGTFLTVPVLIAFYGYLLVRTSPKLVVAALGAARGRGPGRIHANRLSALCESPPSQEPAGDCAKHGDEVPTSWRRKYYA